MSPPALIGRMTCDNTFDNRSVVLRVNDPQSFMLKALWVVDLRDDNNVDSWRSIEAEVPYPVDPDTPEVRTLAA